MIALEPETEAQTRPRATEPDVPVTPSPEPRANAALALVLGAALLIGCAVQLLSRTPAAPPESAVALRIDPNSASAAELELLPGIGPKIAENIIAQRERQPDARFRHAADLDAVPRIGQKTIERLRSVLALEEDRD